MPEFNVTSPSGSEYKITVPEGDEKHPLFEQELKKRIEEIEGSFEQSLPGAFASSALQGLTGVVAEPIRGAGELIGADTALSLSKEIAGMAKYNAPVSPELDSSLTAQGGQAIGQGAGQLALALAAGKSGMGARGVQATVLTPAFFAGAAGGADESRRLGLEEGSAEDVANKLLYGGSELLSESIFGLGSKAFSKELVSDAPRVLLRGTRTTAAGRGTKAVGQEALEEPIAGAMQDVSSRLAVEFGGQGDFFGSTTDNGAELRNPLDPEARAKEALFGAIGALPFGVAAAMRGDGSVNEVRDYRNKVNKARKDGSIKPKDQTEIDALDTKAKDFLELEGVPLMRNLGQSAVEGTAQGAVELNAIINDPAAAPATRAAAQVKLERFKEQGKKVVEQTDKFLAGDISLDDLRTSVSEYDNLNPYSAVNQEKQLAAAEAAQAAAPVAQVAQANAAAGNTATAAALIDTQAARQRATALRAQARADRKAPAQQRPATQQATPAPVATAAPAPVVSSREQAAREVEASYDEAVRTALPQIDTLVNEGLPALANQVSQALTDGDFETASNLADRLTREATRFQRFDTPEIQQAFTRTLSAEQQEDFKRKRTAAEQLAKDVQRTVSARAKASGTPVGTAVAERMAPKPTQAELSLDTPPITPQGGAPTTATEGPPMSRDSSTPQTAAPAETAAPEASTRRRFPADYVSKVRPIVVTRLSQDSSVKNRYESAIGVSLSDDQATDLAVEIMQQGKLRGDTMLIGDALSPSLPDWAIQEAWNSISKPAPQTPAVDEFGLPVAEAPADQAAIDAAFAELEAQREAPAPAETPQETPAPAPAPAETPPASATEPVVSELDAIDAELAANKIKRDKARQRARAARGRLGFFGGDPVEQAIADGRVWKANVELGYLLLKKGYVRFKIWAREYLRQNADDPASMRLLRRIYRMLRDDPASAASLLDVPADQIESLSGGMDASINNVSLAPEPQIKDPGYFGAIENVLDWAGNTTFFEGRESVPGGGKSHRIYLDEVIEGVTYDLVYRFEGKTYRTGDRVSRHGDEWLFGYGVGAGPRASRFRMYSTTLLTASFTGNNESTSSVAEDTRRNIIAFNQIAQFDASGRLAFNRSDEVARWISSVRYEKDDFRFPVNGDISDSEITVKLAGTEDVVGRFTLRDGVWVFGSGEFLTKGEQTAQDSFAVVGFELEDSKGTTSADTPAKVVAAWPAKSKTYNPLDGFGPAPVNPEGKRVKAKTSEPAFKNYADLESWISAKRMRQGHSLDINKIRRYVRERGPRSFRKYVDKAMDAANKAYDAAYPAEQTSLPVFKARDNRNIGVQYARMVQDSTGARPLFTNNVFETAVQINMGLKVFVPEGFAGAVHPLIQVNPDTREVISASDASGKVSKAGDHLAVRQRDPNVLAKSEARMATEDEMNEALLDDFDFVDGLPKAADEDTMLAEARRKFASMRFSPSATKPFDRALVDLVATANLFAGNRLALLRPVIEETGYSKDGVVLDTAKLPAAIAAARAFIEARRQQAKTQRASLQKLGESTREVEDVSVLPDRLEDLVKAAAKSMVLRNNGGPINYGAYWNRALRRVMQRYNTRIQSGFAAPVATTQYNEEGSEQIDPNDEEQQAAALAAGDVGMTGSSLRFEDVVDEADEPEGGFGNPQKTSGRPVQLDLFGKETTEEAEPDTEDTASVTEEDEPELTENNELGVALTAEVAAEPELTNEEHFQISPEIAAKRNRGQRSTMRRILRDLPVHLKNAVFNSPTTDRFDVVLTSYYAMRSALIRSGVLRSEERPTFREALDLVFKNQDKVKGLDKLFSNSVKEALGQMSRAHAKAPGIPNARKAKAAADALGLVDGDPQSAIDALTRAASLLEIPFGTRMLLKRIAGLKGVSALRGFSMIPMETARGTMLRDRAIINISPSGSVTETAETLGHEFVHLSTEQAFQDLESGTADEAVVRADEELTVIREELASHAFRTMGAGLMVEYSQAFDNNSEFLAYLFSDSKFNAWVSSRPQSFLIRVANAIRKLLGLKVPANTTMDKAWRALLLMSDRPAMFAQTAEAVSRDALELILMSIDERGPGAEARNLMAGVTARVSSSLQESFAKAREMDEAGGIDPETIRRETGWYRAPTDRKWRWEINDKDATVNFAEWPVGVGMENAVALEDLFFHTDLFFAYPGIKNLKVRLLPQDSSSVGVFDGDGIGIRDSDSLTPDQIKKIIIHEVQHYIQWVEGFHSGSSKSQMKVLVESGKLSPEDVSLLLPDLEPNPSKDEIAYALYMAEPGEVEARMAELRADMTDAERRKVGITIHYSRESGVRKLGELAANGGVQAAYDMADTGIEVSTERTAPMWYDGNTDTIKMNPDTISADTEGLSPREVREYMKRLVLHENIHRADNHADTIEERDDYMNAMSEADFEWVATLYYADPAAREFALGRTPGMNADQKAEQRRLLVWEHRRAMVELALKGETTEQFAVFIASNPGLVDHIKRLLWRFVNRLTAKVRQIRYAGSVLDLQGVMETLNNIEEIAPSPDKSLRIAELERRIKILKDQIDNLELPPSSNFLFEDLASKLAIEGGQTPTEDSVDYWSSEISMALRQATRTSDDVATDVGTTFVKNKQGLTALNTEASVARHIKKYSQLYDKLKRRYPAELIKLSEDLKEFTTSGRGALATQLAQAQNELMGLSFVAGSTRESIIAEARSVAVPIKSRRLGNYKVGGWATTGFLNQETAEQQRVRDAKLRAMQARVQMHKDDLAKAVKKEYTSRGLANPESLINEALGSIENPVNPQQLAVAEQLRTRAVRNAVSKFLGQQNLARSQSDPAQGSLIRENARTAYQSELIQARKIKERYLNKVESDWVTATKAKQAAAFATLSPETSTVVRAIRDDIDAMQQQLIQSGVLGPKTAARVTKTFGIYLTRSYQVYNENIVTVSGVKRNLWNEFLRDSKDPKSVAILDAARAAIFEDAVKEKAKELKLANTRARNPIGPFQSLADRDTAIKAAQRSNPVLDSAEALRRARAMLQSNGGVEVETMLEKYLEMGENMDSDTDVLKRRDAIHPAIQALWGVYEQNEYNAFNTMMKINALLANQKLFDEIYKHGKASGYIFDKEGVVVDGQRTVPLGGTGTQANRNRFGILAGKYGPAELKAGLEEAFGGNTQFTSSWWNFVRAATGYAMATKTKYSIQGTARNFVGNIMFAGINLNVHKLFDPRARGVVARQLGLKTKNKTEYDNYIRRLIELRVVSESAYEFRDLTREFSKEALGWMNRATRGRKFLSSAVETARKLDKFAGVAHQGADDFWKVLSFEGELGRVKAWEPNLTQEQAEEKAAWKIRHTMPTYTEAFYFIKRLRQQPFVAPFITFTAEIYRTTFGTIKVGLNEIAEGRANGNRTQMIAGLARISNLVAAIGFMPALMAMLGKAAFGAGEEDEEDGINPGAGEAALRRFVPEYMRNNSLMRFGSGKWDEQIYMDASYLIPHDVLGKILRGAFDAYMKPETIGIAEKAADAGLAFMEQVLEPVTNEQLFFGSIMQAKFNYNQAYDRKIYKDTDTTWDATKAVIAHIYTSALEPGTVRTGRLIMEAADGVVRDGMKMEVGNEMLSVVGIKKRTIMLETRFARNADEHKKLMGEAATYITSPLQSNSTVEDADIKRGYDRANEVRMDSLREARRDYLAATHLGMPQAKAKQLLLDSQLSDDEVALVVGNFYTPYQVSDQVFTKALEKSKAFGQDRVRLYLDAVKQYPKRQPLIPE